MKKEKYHGLGIPKIPLSECVKIIQAIANTGTTTIDLTYLKTNIIAKAECASNFRVKLTTLQKYNLITFGKYHLSLTELALQCINPNTRREALIYAFLSYKPYKSLCKLYMNNIRPDNKMVEEKLLEYGIKSSRVADARRLFYRNANFIQLLAHENRETVSKIIDNPAPIFKADTHTLISKVDTHTSGETKIFRISESSMVSVSLNLKLLELSAPIIDTLFNAISEIEKISNGDLADMSG